MENLKFKGTKGEWDYSFPEHDAKNIYIHAGSDMPLVKVPYNGNYSEANAKLIASAPELLEISKKARTALNMLLHPNDMNNIEFELKARLLAKDVVEELNRIIEKSLK